MARNIEIKARIASITALEPIAASLADQGPFEILQDDTFFTCDAGRMKLRVFSNGEGELIFYRRSDQSGPKESFYVRSPARAPDSLREALSLGYGQIGRVRKHRTLYLAGRTRIHLDKVEGLGEFLELEAVLSDDEPNEAGVATANELLCRLGISEEQLVEGAYFDLLKQAAERSAVEASTENQQGGCGNTAPCPRN
jgi:predicted adenylyl cyclase CyaB